MHLRLILSIALFFAVPALAQHAAHEHGVADLRVAAEGNTVVIEFDSPLDNLVGFEHAPRDDAQRMALRTAEKRLEDVAALFGLSPVAGCEVSEIQVDMPYPQADHDHGGKGGHGHGHTHADMHAVYALECSDVAALDRLTVRLIENFPRISTLRVETATVAGQQSLRVRGAVVDVAL